MPSLRGAEKDVLDLVSGTPCRQTGYKSHIGFGRPVNEDAGWAAAEALRHHRAGRLLAVADGIGGNSGGQIASQYVCKALSAYYKAPLYRRRASRVRDLSRLLTDVIYRIDHGLRVKATQSKTTPDMGTTLSCLVLTASHSIIANVGDSRIYRCRRGHFSCLTKDHTFVQEMITEGEVSPDKADEHPLRHLLTQSVGTTEPLEHVFLHIDRIIDGDRFLLCTDGLYNAVAREHIADMLAMDCDAEKTAERLLSKALANKARDNVTVMVVHPVPASPGC